MTIGEPVNKKNKTVRGRGAYAWLAAAVFAVDRASKAWAVSALRDSPRDVWPGVLRFAYAENTGAAFSALQGSTVLLTVLTALILAALLTLLLLRGGQYPPIARAALWVLLGGGLGNLYDRVAYGYVVDFIEPTFVRFAVFNVADAFMVLAVIVLLGWILLWGNRNDS